MKRLLFLYTLLACCLLLPLQALAGPAARTIRVGVASMVTPVSAVRYYQQIVDYLADKLGMTGEMIHRTTYDEIDRLLEEKRLDVAFICSAPYILNKEKFGAELLVAPVIDGRPFYQSHIIVHRDSGLTALADLRGKTFAFVDPKSNSGRLYPVYELARQGQTPDGYFKRYFFSYSHNKSVEMVAKKKADAAAVDSLVLNYLLAAGSPYAQEVKVIHRSPDFGIPPVVVPPGLPLFLKEKIRRAFLHMHEDRRGREILAAMHIDRFNEVADSNYDSIRTMRDFLDKSAAPSKPRPGREPDSLRQSNVKFGVIPWDNPRIAYEKYQPLLDYLGRQTGLRLELILKKTCQDVVNGLGNGEFHFALLGPLTYLDAHSRFGVVPIAKSKTRAGVPVFHSAIVVGPKSGLNKIAQLAGKRFAFASLWSTSGNLLPRLMLAFEGIHLEKLAGYSNFNYHDTVVKKVLSGEYDAGAVRQSVAEKYTPHGLVTIALSDPIPTGPVVVSPQAPYSVVRQVQQALLAMAADPEGRAVLLKLDSELQGGFIPASDADYSGVRMMINEVPTTCGLGCHPKVNF